MWSEEGRAGTSDSDPVSEPEPEAVAEQVLEEPEALAASVKEPQDASAIAKKGTQLSNAECG